MANRIIMRRVQVLAPTARLERAQRTINRDVGRRLFNIENGVSMAAVAAPTIETHRMVTGKVTEEQYQALVVAADDFNGVVLATSSFVLEAKRNRRLRRRVRDRLTRDALLRAQQRKNLRENIPEPAVDLAELMGLVPADLLGI